LQLLFSVQVTAGTLYVAVQSAAEVVQAPSTQLLPEGQSAATAHQLVPAKAGVLLVASAHSELSQMPSPEVAGIGPQKSQFEPPDLVPLLQYGVLGFCSL
jgi:hypothetical protein